MTEYTLGDGERDRLRHQLEARRRQVLDDLQRRLSRIRQVDARLAAPERVGEDVNDIDVGLVDIMSGTLHRIDAALERLADGRYGQCARCEQAIEEARLRALPFAACCTACESAREQDAALRQARVRAPGVNDRLAMGPAEDSPWRGPRPVRVDGA